MWCKSPRFNRVHLLNPKLLQCSFVKLTADFPKRLTSLYMVFHIGHAPLNKHLHRIGKSESPHCPHCPNIDESVYHILITCLHYRHEHHSLTCALRCNTTSIPFLLSDLEATLHLICFRNAMGQMKATFGEVPLPRAPADK
ncbi:hypothetical protein EV702DRAFT_962186 [Suillus placidus]|uniref:Reverse transcriptase zinc-binding domain-containing protein n=1 Tax=Suillus placidus TaxID=48579 RepID=A0A9P7D5X0_9AGAM|nr:hypothetical protein EV702DRAFT_962186 [Suillus placidus]